jgi:hypothetical protein
MYPDTSGFQNLFQVSPSSGAVNVFLPGTGLISNTFQVPAAGVVAIVNADVPVILPAVAAAIAVTSAFLVIHIVDESPGGFLVPHKALIFLPAAIILWV